MAQLQNTYDFKIQWLILSKARLHIVVTIAEHDSDVAPKRILRLSIYRSLQLCEYQGIPGKLRKRVCKPCACDTYDLYEDQALYKQFSVKNDLSILVPPE